MKQNLQLLSKNYYWALICIFFIQNIVGQTQLASWNYDSQVQAFPGTFSADYVIAGGSASSAIVNLGGGTVGNLIRTGMTGTGCGAQTTGNSFALEPFSPGSSNESNGFQYNSSTSGYQNIIFSWDQRCSGYSANTVRLQYTINGSTWTNFIMTGTNTTFCLGSINTNGCFENSVVSDNFRRVSVDLSSIVGANNNPNFGVRILASYYASSSAYNATGYASTAAQATGTWRFDNVSFAGTQIPGPTASVFSANSSICLGNSANLSVAITGGTGPFKVVYQDNASTPNVYTVSNYVSGSSISLSPTITYNYSLVSVTSANGLGGIGTGNSGSPRITVNQLPTITVSSTATTICQGTTTSTLSYTATTNSPNKYNIVWSVSNPSVLANVTNVTLVNAPSSISITVPALAASGTYTGNLTVTNSITTCPSIVKSFTLVINGSPAIITNPSTSNQAQCFGNSYPSISVVASGAGLAYQWYSNPTNSNIGGASLGSANGAQTSTYTPQANFAGTQYYYVRVVGSCLPAIPSSCSGAYTITPASVGGNTVPVTQIFCTSGIPNDITLSANIGVVVKWQKALDAAFTVSLTDIPASAGLVTLTGAQIGTVSQNTYFRAVVQNSTCTIAYSGTSQVTFASTTWNGSTWSNGAPDSITKAIFASSYTSAGSGTGDLTACSVELLSNALVTFSSGDTFTVLNDIIVFSGPLPATLTFENNASLVQINNVSNTSYIYYKRNSTPMLKYDYTYWSSPVLGQTLYNFSPNTLSDKYLSWNASTYGWNWETSSNTMSQAKGYIIRAPDIAPFNTSTRNSFNGQFFGIPNNGPITTPIFASGSNNLNLIGNPYPSAVNADDFLNFNKLSNGGVLNGTIYFWTHNTPVSNLVYNNNDYASYNLTGGAGTQAAPSNPCSGCNNSIPDGTIAAGEAFFIQGIANGTATFNNSMRKVGGNAQFFKTSSVVPASFDSDKNRIWLELSNQSGAIKQALIGYVTGATDGLDAMYDGGFIDVGNPVQLYSLLNNDKLTIQGKALPFNNNDQVLLGFKATVAGTLELKLSNFDGLFLNQTVYIEDVLLNTIHNLSASPYSFVTTSGTFNNRFVLRFTNSTLGTKIFSANNCVVFIDNGIVKVNVGNETIKNISIYDMQGRMISDFKNINSSDFSCNSPQANSVLLLKIEIFDGEIVYKKVLN